MALELSKEQAGKDAATAELKKLGKKKRGPGRPKGSGKRGPGRPKGSKNKPAKKRGRKPGPKPGRKAAKAGLLKGYVKQAEAKRLAKAAVAKLKAQLPGLVRRQLLKLLK